MGLEVENLDSEAGSVSLSKAAAAAAAAACFAFWSGMGVGFAAGASDCRISGGWLRGSKLGVCSRLAAPSSGSSDPSCSSGLSDDPDLGLSVRLYVRVRRGPFTLYTTSLASVSDGSSFGRFL